jgi:hypothetical protein
MNPEVRTHQLTSELDPWEIRLVSGHILHLKAHAYSKKGRSYVFVALMKGSPHYFVELSRLPISAVKTILGG